MLKMNNLRLGIYLVIRDIWDNIIPVVFITLSLGLLFANVLFSRLMIYGFQVNIASLILKVSGHKYIDHPKGDSFIYKTQEEISKIAGNKNFSAVNPVLEMPCILEYKDMRIITNMWGVESGERVMDLRNHISEGTYFSSDDAKEVILGKLLKKKINQKLRDNEKVEFNDTVQSFFIKEYNINEPGRTVYEKSYCTLVGMADLRDYVANNYCFMPIKTLQSIAYLKDRSTGILIRFKDDASFKNFDIEELKALDIKGIIKNWTDRDDYGIDDMAKGFSVVGLVIFLVSIVCAATLVAFVVYYNTQKKRVEMGILRAIGVCDRVFMYLFVIEGILFSILGIICGTFFYFGLQSYLEKHPIILSFGDLYPIFETNSYIFVIITFLSISFVASLYYGITGSRIDIIKVIRGD